MRINVATVNSGWILQKIAERICETDENVFSISHSPREDVDANFYIDVQNCYQGKTSTIDIGFFTHLHENSLSYLNPHWLSLDHIVHMCSRYRDMFAPYYPKERMSRIIPGELSPNFKLKKPTIGIFQRGMHKGKGFPFMKKMAEKDVFKKFKFLFVGKDWGEVIDLYKTKGVEVSVNNDESYEKYPKLYSSIDYLLIPSLWEAGPMSAIEALGCGIPIISSYVGWMGIDLDPEYLFTPNNDVELELIFTTIFNKIKSRRDQVKDLSYKNYANKIIKIIENIK